MSILLFIIILVALILVHEFGHFVVAKKSGIRVDEFGIGFPPKLFSKKYGETEYSFNALPLGGFVKIFGEDPSKESVSGQDSERSFINKPKTVQAAVLFAGVLFNILFAWMLFSIGFTVGMPQAVDEDTRGVIKNTRVLVGEVIPDSPAEAAGLLPGDELLALESGADRVAVLDPAFVSTFVSGREGEEVVVSYKRGNEILTGTVVPETGIVSGRDDAAIGVAVGLTGLVLFPFPFSIVEGARFTLKMLALVTVAIFSFLANAITLQADFSQIAGPVGIVSLVGDASSLGVIYLMSFTAIISLNLAVINLLPFPALDGGRLLFVLVEAVKGSPIKPIVANVLNTFGFALLILLMLVVTYNDIIRLAG